MSAQMSIFTFKQFRMHHGACGMKISSAACTFAAWAARHGKGKKVLDIGAGSGVITLMLAQQHTADFVAIEIEPEAAQEATDNFLHSPWANRLQLVCGDVGKWASTQPQQSFDWIVSNPPFFVNQVKNENDKRRFARHADTLTPDTLAGAVAFLLAENGICQLLLPPEFSSIFVQALAENQIFATHCVFMRDTPQSPRTFGEIWTFARQKNNALITAELILYETDRTFHAHIQDLLKEYYIVF